MAGHTPSNLGIGSLDTYGGLCTYARPRDLPEGASPRSYDVHYEVGSVGIRPGLASVYSFASVLNINTIAITSGGLAVFSYTSTITPTINEEFTLSGFQGTLFFLNGTIIFATSVNPLNHTFTTVVPMLAVGTFSNLSGIATSNTGLFVGPNIPTQVEDIPNAIPWTNPNGVLGNVTYANVSAGIGNLTIASGSGKNITTVSAQPWSGTNDIFSTSAFATVTLSQTGLQDSQPLLATLTGPALPATASIVGLAISTEASATYSASGPGSQGPNPCSYGYSTTWVSASNITGVGYATFANSSPGTTHDSGLLIAKQFGFSIPATATITGITATFTRYKSSINGTRGATGATVKDTTIQLLKNGAAVGSNFAQTSTDWTTSPLATTYGGSANLWGTTWTPADINNANFGIEIDVAAKAGTAKSR